MRSSRGGRGFRTARVDYPVGGPFAAIACVAPPRCPSSLEQGALDELREDRNDLHLHVPLLAVLGTHGHVLQRERELDGQPPQLHHLAHTHADWHRPDVPGRRLPVRQDIARVEDVPALAEEERRDGLQIELARVWPSGGAADGEPLLGEHAEEELLREVARHHARPGLYLALAGEL